METQEQDLRKAALNEACRHRLATESAENVVQNAQKYYEFLKGESDK